MEHGRQVESLKGRDFARILPNEAYEDCLAALGSPRQEAVMLLNDRGRILFCNPEWESVGRCSADDIVGGNVRDFIPGLRLNPAAPGSNVAHATYSGRRNQWSRHDVLDGQGHRHDVELLLDVLMVDLNYLIVLRARKATLV